MEQDTACVVVFQVREGRLIGEHHFFLEGITGLEERQVLTAFIKSYYLWPASVPLQVLLCCAIDEKEVIAKFLEEKAGRKVALLVPQRGKKRELVELAAKNARHYLEEALSREEMGDRKAEEALLELKSVLGLSSLPQRIECYDISNLFGSQAAGSMVVFEGGKPRKADYRRFRIQMKEGEANDFAMMREVLGRRLQAGLEGSERFKHMPDLILVDGGKGQLNVALRSLQEAGLRIPAAGLAKEFEHLFLPGCSEPIVLPRHSRSLHLLQAIRDEAHRFAISYHRSLKRREAITTILRSVPGIGPKRQQVLLKRFPSLEAIRQAGIEEVAKVPGMSRAAAESLLTNLRSKSSTGSGEEE
jgi:excinuclease ABC subunit C